MKFVHEVYIRKDISCGWVKCPNCTHPIQYLNFEDNKVLFIPDFQTLQSYYDILTNAQLTNILVTQTIAELMRQ